MSSTQNFIRTDHFLDFYEETFRARMVLTLRSNCFSICCSSTREQDCRPSPKSFLMQIPFVLEDFQTYQERERNDNEMTMQQLLEWGLIEPFRFFKELYLLHQTCCLMLHMLHYCVSQIKLFFNFFQETNWLSIQSKEEA